MPSLESLFASHAAYVAVIAHRILGRTQDVDDTVQDVFVEAQRGLASVRDPKAITGWLATVTVRIARRQLRRRRVRRWVGLDGGLEDIVAASSEASPEQRAQIVELYAGLDRLPVALRLAWTLRRVHGSTNPEVAAHCDCSLATAKRRIAEAERRLRRMGVIDV